MKQVFLDLLLELRQENSNFRYIEEKVNEKDNKISYKFVLYYKEIEVLSYIAKGDNLDDHYRTLVRLLMSNGLKELGKEEVNMLEKSVEILKEEINQKEQFMETMKFQITDLTKRLEEKTTQIPSESVI